MRFSLQGTQGEPGYPGDAGAEGSPGTRGDRGENGKPGDNGKRVSRMDTSLDLQMTIDESVIMSTARASVDDDDVKC